MNFCPKCGFSTENMKFCPNCGFELVAPVEGDLSTASKEQTENVIDRFADYHSDIIDQPLAQADDSDEEEIRNLRAALVGEKANHYIPIFESLDKNGGQSWNWCGCLFAPMWFAYRKLYGWSTIAVFAPVLIGFFIGFALVSASAVEGTTNIISRCIGIGCAIAFGVISNSAYKKRIDNLIAEMPLGEKERNRFIDKKGGVSVVGLVLALVVNLGLSMLLTMASM